MKFTDLLPFGRRDKDMVSYSDIFTSFRRDLDNLFDKTFSSFAGSSAINLDVKNEENQILVTAEVPGASEENLSINLTGNILTIKAERKQEKEEDKNNYYLRECSYGTTARSLQLPFYIDQKNIQAELENGILTIKIPKPKEVQGQSKKIPIYKK